jgi:tRNA C32,U32 (ribose-2'-O)-methylase TrmJ
LYLINGAAARAPRLRRLFARANLEKEEVNILRGFLTSLTKPKWRPPK